MSADVFREEEAVKKVTFGVWKQILKIILRSKKELALLLIFAVFMSLAEASTIPLNAYAISNLIETYNESALLPFIVLSVTQIVVFAFGVFGFIYFGSKLETQVRYTLRKESFKNLQKLPFSYYDSTKQGWIMARMTSDTNRLARIVSWGILDLTWSGFFMFFTIVVLFISEWRLALVFVSFLPILLFIAIIFRKKVLILNRKSRFHNSQLTGLFNESFLGAKTTKSLAIESELSDEFTKEARVMKKVTLKAILYGAIFSSFLLAGSYTIVAFVMALGGYFALQGLVTMPILFMFIRAAMNTFEPILNLTNFINELQVAQASAERVLQLVNEKPSIDDTQEVKDVYGDLFDKKKENWEEIKGDVEFKDVTFYYNPKEIILDKFNLKVKAGQTVALVGHTGSGKTTIVNLFARFYEPRAGEILIDGKDYRKRSLSWLHSRLGYVLQMPELFSTSIKENIRYGNLEASDEEVIAASKAVGLDEFVNTLEKGYDTHVGEAGNLLSVGQKQLISFARAIIADPRILILDEATSSIDSEAEAKIQKATDELLKGRTSFVVAHRLSTIVNSDLIVVLENGKIIEQGTHAELLGNRGHYFELYRNQFIAERREEKYLEID
ncbi:MAG TPA: ABC transporter ATP-binding protein [Bacilli bacterium]|jgi:ATP-binding cassette subfamily B protein|nr:ABC transporter ATP-binding protein [Bacilli bacterium]